jgi:hypothetical protein
MTTDYRSEHGAAMALRGAGVCSAFAATIGAGAGGGGGNNHLSATGTFGGPHMRPDVPLFDASVGFGGFNKSVRARSISVSMEAGAGAVEAAAKVRAEELLLDEFFSSHDESDTMYVCGGGSVGGSVGDSVGDGSDEDADEDADEDLGLGLGLGLGGSEGGAPTHDHKGEGADSTDSTDSTDSADGTDSTEGAETSLGRRSRTVSLSTNTPAPPSTSPSPSRRSARSHRSHPHRPALADGPTHDHVATTTAAATFDAMASDPWDCLLLQ